MTSEQRIIQQAIEKARLQGAERERNRLYATIGQQLLGQMVPGVTKALPFLKANPVKPPQPPQPQPAPEEEPDDEPQDMPDEQDQSLPDQDGGGDDQVDISPHQALFMAIVDYTLQEKKAGRDPTNGIKAMRELFDDPDKLAELMNAAPPTVHKSYWALIEKAGFTGEKKDSLGRKIKYQDGKRVKNSEVEPAPDAKPGTAPDDPATGGKPTANPDPDAKTPKTITYGHKQEYAPAEVVGDTGPQHPQWEKNKAAGKHADSRREKAAGWVDGFMSKFKEPGATLTADDFDDVVENIGYCTVPQIAAARRILNVNVHKARGYDRIPHIIKYAQEKAASMKTAVGASGDAGAAPEASPTAAPAATAKPATAPEPVADEAAPEDAAPEETGPDPLDWTQDLPDQPPSEEIPDTESDPLDWTQDLPDGAAPEKASGALKAPAGPSRGSLASKPSTPAKASPSKPPSEVVDDVHAIPPHLQSAVHKMVPAYAKQLGKSEADVHAAMGRVMKNHGEEGLKAFMKGGSPGLKKWHNETGGKSKATPAEMSLGRPAVPTKPGKPGIHDEHIAKIKAEVAALKAKGSAKPTATSKPVPETDADLVDSQLEPEPAGPMKSRPGEVKRAALGVKPVGQGISSNARTFEDRRGVTRHNEPPASSQAHAASHKERPTIAGGVNLSSHKSAATAAVQAAPTHGGNKAAAKQAIENAKTPEEVNKVVASVGAKPVASSPAKAAALPAKPKVAVNPKTGKLEGQPKKAAPEAAPQPQGTIDKTSASVAEPVAKPEPQPVEQTAPVEQPEVAQEPEPTPEVAPTPEPTAEATPEPAPEKQAVPTIGKLDKRLPPALAKMVAVARDPQALAAAAKEGAKSNDIGKLQNGHHGAHPQKLSINADGNTLEERYASIARKLADAGYGGHEKVAAETAKPKGVGKKVANAPVAPEVAPEPAPAQPEAVPESPPAPVPSAESKNSPANAPVANAGANAGGWAPGAPTKPAGKIDQNSARMSEKDAGISDKEPAVQEQPPAQETPPPTPVAQKQRSLKSVTKPVAAPTPKPAVSPTASETPVAAPVAKQVVTKPADGSKEIRAMAGLERGQRDQLANKYAAALHPAAKQGVLELARQKHEESLGKSQAKPVEAPPVATTTAEPPSKKQAGKPTDKNHPGLAEIKGMNKNLTPIGKVSHLDRFSKAHSDIERAAILRQAHKENGTTPLGKLKLSDEDTAMIAAARAKSDAAKSGGVKSGDTTKIADSPESIAARERMAKAREKAEAALPQGPVSPISKPQPTIDKTSAKVANAIAKKKGKTPIAAQGNVKAAIKSGFGDRGDNHPLSGESQNEKLDAIATALGKARDGHQDPLGYRSKGFPEGVDRAELAGDMERAAAAMPSHGIEFDDLYDAVGKKHNMSKEQFGQAMTAFADDGDDGNMKFMEYSPDRMHTHKKDPDLAIVGKHGDAVYQFRLRNQSAVPEKAEAAQEQKPDHNHESKVHEAAIGTSKREIESLKKKWHDAHAHVPEEGEHRPQEPDWNGEKNSNINHDVLTKQHGSHENRHTELKKLREAYDKHLDVVRGQVDDDIASTEKHHGKPDGSGGSVGITDRLAGLLKRTRGSERVEDEEIDGMISELRKLPVSQQKEIVKRILPHARGSTKSVVLELHSKLRAPNEMAGAGDR